MGLRLGLLAGPMGHPAGHVAAGRLLGVPYNRSMQRFNLRDPLFRNRGGTHFSVMSLNPAFGCCLSVCLAVLLKQVSQKRKLFRTCAQKRKRFRICSES